MAKPSKRVLHVLYQFEHSGAERMLLQSAAAWRRRGYSLDLVAIGPRAGPLEGPLRQAGFRTFHLPFRSQLRYLPAPLFAPRFLALCREGSYDVLHLHTEAAMPLLVALGRAAAVPTIVRTVHNVFAFQGVLGKRKRLERDFARAAGVRFAFVSESVEQVEAECFSNPGICTPNWFDTERFRPPTEAERAAARETLQCPAEARVLVSVGNCNHAKNHTALLEALAIARSVAGRSLLYLHVGREQPDEPERRMARTLGLERMVRFVGSQADPRPYLWAADLFVMPSLHEGLGNSALEALGAGTPALITRVAGLKDIARRTEFVALVEPTAEALAAGLVEALATPDALAREHALADSAAIHREYSIEGGVGQLVRALYRDTPASALLAEHARVRGAASV